MGMYIGFILIYIDIKLIIFVFNYILGLILVQKFKKKF